MSEFTTVDWPAWKDAGRKVEFIDEAGKLLSGKLFVEDALCDGEDEIPVFSVYLDDGSEGWFGANAGWRFVENEVAK